MPSTQGHGLSTGRKERKTRPMIKQRRTCRQCGRDFAADYQSRVECCGQLTRRGEYEFPSRTAEDLHERKLHMISMLEDPDVEWTLEDDPVAIFEIWQLAPGRAKGELLGYVGCRQTAVEWVMPNGIAIRGGFSNTVEDAVGCMLEALEGGVFSSARVRAEIA